MVEGMLAPSETAMQPLAMQRSGIVTVQFVLCSARQRDGAFFSPWTTTFHVFAVVFVGVFFDATALYILQVEHIVQFFQRDAFGIVDVTVGVGEGNHLTTEFEHLFSRIGGYIA